MRTRLARRLYVGMEGLCHMAQRVPLCGWRWWLVYHVHSAIRALWMHLVIVECCYRVETAQHLWTE